MPSRRFKSPSAEIDALESLGRVLAEYFDCPLTDLRYAEYRPFTAEGRLTKKARWERLVDGEWIEADAPALHAPK